MIFPQFGSLGPLRKHGLVRDLAWQRQSHHSGDVARLAFHTRVEPAPAWPHQALLTLAGQAAGGRLSMSFHVENCGDAPFGFTGALHTYLAVSRSRAASLEGLAGCRAIDALDGGTSTVLGPGPLSAVGPRDVMVRGAPDTVTLHDADRPPMGLVSTGFRSWVVWNPGPGHGLVDVGDGDEAHFVCVEPAVLDPVTLDPGQAWLGSLTLTVHR